MIVRSRVSSVSRKSLFFFLSSANSYTAKNLHTTLPDISCDKLLYDQDNQQIIIITTEHEPKSFINNHCIFMTQTYSSGIMYCCDPSICLILFHLLDGGMCAFLIQIHSIDGSMVAMPAFNC